MRLYSFVNFYLSSIQQGIQTAHVLQELNNTYRTIRRTHPGREILHKWAESHKTIIALNGGDRASIEKTYFRLFDLCPALGLPFGKFHEDNDSLGGIITSCCVVVPESLYAAVPLKDLECEDIMGLIPVSPDNTYFYKKEAYLNTTFTAYHPDTPAWELIGLIKSCSLAR